MPAASCRRFFGVALLGAVLAAGSASGEALSPARQAITHLTTADTLLKSGKLEEARNEFKKLETIADAPEHLLREARQRIEEIDLRKANSRAADSISSRVKLPILPRAGLTLHVSPKGKDTNPGTGRKPFASLERARDEIRSLKQRGALPQAGVVVLVHGGEYQVTQTFKLAAEDSGTETTPVVYRAAQGETPRFRGGVQLTGFKPVQAQTRLPAESAGKVMELDLKASGVTTLIPLKLGGFASGHGFKTHPAHELFFDGKGMQLARGPNEGWLHIKEVAVKDGTKGYDRQGSKVGKFLYEGDRPQRWLGEPDLLLYGYWFWDWADSYERVASIDPEKRLITLAEPWHNYGFSIGAPFYAINALSELDLPGEYYIDRNAGKLYFYPPSSLRKATVELSLRASPMMEMENVSHVRFEGLTWEVGCADAVQVRGGTNCLLAGCTVRQFAGTGVTIHGGRRHGILSCNIYSLGRGGTIISGGDRKTLTPGGHFIENCDIHELSRIDHTYTPAVVLDGVGNRIVHNRFHEILSSAMRVGGNDHIIEFNEIFNAVLESDDQGGADMFGNATYRGNVFRYNYWHHIGNWRGTGEQPKCGQAGIRLDDAISGTLIYGNIFERCSAGKTGFGGVQIHGGKDNIVDNNLFLDCAAAISLTPWDQNRWKDFVKSALSNNAINQELYLKRYPALNTLAENANTNHVYRNLIVHCGEFLRRAPKTIELVDNTILAEGKCTLRDDDALLNRPGFARIPVENIGLYKDGFRKSVEKFYSPKE
ncbi:MAG TPA: right-handed parallel beta-helix repeat-containing protein [Clostridia bacterium]|nr:right-handed parallel beta-helix repeat-containing protein [Clostridia bacterium]